MSACTIWRLRNSQRMCSQLKRETVQPAPSTTTSAAPAAQTVAPARAQHDQPPSVNAAKTVSASAEITR